MRPVRGNASAIRLRVGAVSANAQRGGARIPGSVMTSTRTAVETRAPKNRPVLAPSRTGDVCETRVARLLSVMTIPPSAGPTVLASITWDERRPRGLPGGIA